MAEYTSLAGEGRTPHDPSATTTWATARAAASCSTAVDGTGIVLCNDGVDTYRIHRFFLPFDTSALPADATISSAKVSFYRSDAVTALANDDTDSVHLVTQTQANEASLATTDYNEVSFTSKGSIAFGSTSNTAYNDITISDFTIITKAGTTKLALISGRDQGNSAPTGDNKIGFQGRGDANPPKLTVEYTVPGGGNPMFFSTGGIAVG